MSQLYIGVSRFDECRKDNPDTCRLHRKKYAIYQQNLKTMVKYQGLKKPQEHHKEVLEDLKQNLKKRKEADGTYSVSVYRSGETSPSFDNSNVMEEIYKTAEKFVPDGRQGRIGAVFASPTLGGVRRWVTSNAIDSRVNDPQVREMRVNPDKVYVYSVKTWEETSVEAFTEKNPELLKAYWDSGVTLSQWLEIAERDVTIDPTEWEILLPVNSFADVKILSPNKVESAAYDDRFAEVEETLKTS